MVASKIDSIGYIDIEESFRDVWIWSYWQRRPLWSAKPEYDIETEASHETHPEAKEQPAIPPTILSSPPEGW
jgi:hypothetical protein